MSAISETAEKLHDNISQKKEEDIILDAITSNNLQIEWLLQNITKQIMELLCLMILNQILIKILVIAQH